MADYNQHKPVTGYPAAQSSYPPPGAAYPYHAPPPAPYFAPNPYPPPPPPYDPRRALFLRRLIAATIAVFIIIGAITFILWLVLRPRLPKFSVTSASVTHFNLSSSSQLTADWDVSLSVFNSNSKMGIYYDRVQASVIYGSDRLAETSLAPFYQAKRNLTSVRAIFAAASEYVDGGVVRGIAEDRNRRGSVNFHVRLLAWVRFKSGAWRTRRHLMRVFCENVVIGFPSSNGTGTLLGGPRGCDVDL